ncbi:hypothetical protein CJ195_19090 [Bacillus sp. UMB0899]|nr:hypothetical protein CJ195_19090 [Bacillus sp. UMB0899]
MTLTTRLQTSKVKAKETKAGMIIQIMEPPKPLKRPLSQGRQIQDHSMMFFQQLVMKNAVAALRAKSLDIFKNKINIEIEIVSMESPNTLRLELILKTLFDSLNKNVIDDDSLIENAQIWLKKATKRNPKTQIKVSLEDIKTRECFSFSCQLPVIEKMVAVPYEINAAMSQHPKSAVDMQNIQQLIMSNVQTQSRYDICHMLFNTSDASVDVDNLLLTYIDIIRQQGFLNHSTNIGIGLYKRHVERSAESVIISLVSK